MTNHDLIAQVGGYESARKLLRDQSGMDPEVSINGEMVLVDIVDDALLKYRTERGIFEVGDLVVPIAKPIALDMKIKFRPLVRRMLGLGI